MATVYYKIDGIEIFDDTENSIERMNKMRHMEKLYAKRKANKKRKERIEDIKLFFVLFFFNVLLPLIAICHWMLVGY